MASSNAGSSGQTRVERLEPALRHTSLPKLADAGFIAVARDGRPIERCERRGQDRLVDQAARADGYVPPAAGDSHGDSIASDPTATPSIDLS